MDCNMHLHLCLLMLYNFTVQLVNYFRMVFQAMDHISAGVNDIQGHIGFNTLRVRVLVYCI